MSTFEIATVSPHPGETASEFAKRTFPGKSLTISRENKILAPDDVVECMTNFKVAWI